MKISIFLKLRKSSQKLSQELTVTQDYLVSNVFHLFVFTFEPMEFSIISESYIRQKCLMYVMLNECRFFTKKSYGVDRRSSGQNVRQ